MQLSTENILDLQDVAYIPSIRRNLISVPILDRLDIIFFLDLEKLNCTEILYSLAMKYFVGGFID